MIYTSVDDLMKAAKHIMIDIDLRQSDIAESTGWSKQTVSNLLSGRTKNIGIDTLAGLAHGMGCDLVIDFVPKKRKNDVF